MYYNANAAGLEPVWQMFVASFSHAVFLTRFAELSRYNYIIGKKMLVEIQTTLRKMKFAL